MKSTMILSIFALLIGVFFLALFFSDAKLRKDDLSDTMIQMHKLLEVTKVDGEYYLYDSQNPGRSWELDKRFGSLVSEGSWHRFWVEVHDSSPVICSKYEGKESFMKKYTYFMASNYELFCVKETE